MRSGKTRARKKIGPDESLNIFGTDYAQQMIYFTISVLPTRIARFAGDNFAFICDVEEIDGLQYTFDDPLFKGKRGFILLAPHIWKESKLEITYIIAHEIAHAWRQHKKPETGADNKTRLKMVRRQYLKNEKEADALVLQWLGSSKWRGYYFPYRSLLKLIKRHSKTAAARSLLF